MEKKHFYKMVFALVVPMAIQNLINVGVGAADVIMLGRVGETALSAVSLANQVSFILNLFVFGMTSGASVLTAQYWGKKDIISIEKIMGITLRLALIAGAVFMIAAFVMPRSLMLIFTTEEAIIAEGIKYLRFVAISYLLAAVNQTYLNLIRSFEKVIIGTVTYAISIVVNIFFNAIFIFGLFGCPAMGAAGAALGTTIARFTEFGIVLIYNRKYNDVLKVRLKILLLRDKLLMKDFFKYAMPVLINELVWGSGMAMLSAIVGHMGSSVVAAHSVAQTSRQLAMVISLGIGNAAAIVLGRMIGEGRTELAEESVKRFVKLAAVFGLFGGLLIYFVIRPLMFVFMVLTPEAKEYLGYMMFIMSYYLFFQSMGTVFIVGIFRAGGDTRAGLVIDTVFLWMIAIPLGAVAAFVLHLPVPVVYAILMCDEILKLPVDFWRYRTKKWLRNVTR